MLLDTHSCYQALVSHDRRFDGAFFVGVSSTGVYCRTVCTARTPSLKNCKFFVNAALAEHAGYRPCLRCRPELAPGSATVDAMNRSATVIASMIEEGALNCMTVSELAAELGMSERHLRRVVESAFGVSPLELAQTQRLLLAKRLLADSRLTITEVAMASGFTSLRRFNALLKERYGMSPSQMRANRQSAQAEESIQCQLSYRPPFDWDSLLKFLSMRSIAQVEAVEPERYARTVSMGNERGWIAICNDRQRSALQVDVSVSLARALMPLLSRVKRLFDLSCDPALIQNHLGELAGANPGLRLPGAFDGFETALRAVLGQQVSVKAASTLMTRLCLLAGEPIDTPIPGLSILSPEAKRVAELKEEELLKIGITRARARTISALAKAVASGALSLDQAIDPEKRIKQFTDLPGIGDWTAHYLAMRVLNWPDAFPYSDLGIRKALKTDKDKEILALAEGWRPWRAYAAMHLWKTLEV